MRQAVCLVLLKFEETENRVTIPKDFIIYLTKQNLHMSHSKKIHALDVDLSLYPNCTFYYLYGVGPAIQPLNFRFLIDKVSVIMSISHS